MHNQVRTDPEVEPRPLPPPAEEICECCIADGVRRRVFVMDTKGFLMCKKCYEGRCPNCGGEA